MKAKSVKVWFLALLFSLSAFNTFAQDSIVVKGIFLGNTKYARVLMKKFEGGSFVVGSAPIKNEKFALTLPPDIPAGVYRFVYSVLEGEQFVDIIINGKDKNIAFTLQADEPDVIPQFTHSEENKLWYTYIQQNKAQLDRVSLLNQFINAYPNTVSKVYQEALKEWETEKEMYWENFEQFKTTMKGSLAYEMVVNRPYYFTNPKDHPRLQDFYKHQHFWEGFNAHNPALINTPLYTEHILNYLRYWMDPNMGFSQEEQIKGFKSAVDTIMQKFAGTHQTQVFAYKYLTLGFKEIGQDDVLKYLDEKYKTLAEQCLNEIEKTEYDKRMEGYANLKVGNIAPEIVFPDTLMYPNPNFRPKKLSDFKSNYTLVVFGSSWCPACTEEVPKIASSYRKWSAQGVDVLLVSLDEDIQAFYQFAAQLPFISITDLKKWNSPIAQEYFIYGTPTMYLLDNNRKIILRGTSFQQINTWVDWHLVKGNAFPRG
ncbi:AhpC/TSA family protein [Flavobacteriales bacterium]|nr:AhpC/TSA family protein [Flavobacteriales bacterium]